MFQVAKYKCVVYTSDQEDAKYRTTNHKMSRRHKLMPPLCKTRKVKLNDVYYNLVLCGQSEKPYVDTKSLPQVVYEMQQSSAISIYIKEGP